MEHIVRMPDEDYRVLLAAIQRLEARFDALEARVSEIWEAIASTPHGPGILEIQRRHQELIVQIEHDYRARITTVLDELHMLSGRVADLERAPERAASKELEALREERLRGRRTWHDSWIRALVSGLVGALAVVGSTVLLFGQQIRQWLSGGGP